MIKVGVAVMFTCDVGMMARRATSGLALVSLTWSCYALSYGEGSESDGLGKLDTM